MFLDSEMNLLKAAVEKERYFQKLLVFIRPFTFSLLSEVVRVYTLQDFVVVDA